MSLYSELQKAKSEQDVKIAYINALQLKGFNQTLIDIETREVWFEAKKTPTATYIMFTQLLHYVVQAKKKGAYIPPLLCVIDNVKAALMRTSDVMPLLERTSIQWGKSASSFSQEALIEVSSFIGVYIVSFVIETHEEEFLTTMKNAIRTGQINRLSITPYNLRQVFDHWVGMIGKEIRDIPETHHASLFFADIMNDGTKPVLKLLEEVYHTDSGPVFFLEDKRYTLKNHEGYRRFWSIWDRPPKEEHREYLLARRDSLLPIEERMFKGAYYTPLSLVTKAYELLSETLGTNWQKDYILWDVCCGVGNLEAKHNYPRNIFMSTLDQADINIMKTSKICVGSERFQYDYLTDDIADDGSIDYSLTNKLPQSLRDAIQESKKGTKKMLILINPPYAEAGNGISVKDGKAGVSDTKWAKVGMGLYGKAKNEIFAQFLVRIQEELPLATLAVFSTPKYINSESFRIFQQKWTGDYKGGFAVDSKAFDGISGSFPITFLIWKLGNGKTLQENTPILLNALDKKGNLVGSKPFYPLSSSRNLNTWIERLRSQDLPCIPLKNAITPSVTYTLSRWHQAALGYMVCHGNHVALAQQKTLLLSSVFGDGHGFYITADNLLKAAVTFSVRMSTKHTWLNHQDQFYIPQSPPSKELETDCLIYMLFSNKNLTASAELDWNGKKWEMINHFIPFSEAEVKSPDRFYSSFMKDFLDTLALSIEAKNVLLEGQKLWIKYFDTTDDFATCTQLHLFKVDVGWYQIRRALEARNTKGISIPTSFKPFEQAYKVLEEKIQPKFLELGFIK